MTKRMLIDATHDEETRVAVVDGTRLMEFDYESKVRRQLKGTIFLAKVTRVEPSLQAAFVNFGGNRHGFLPFSEIHPDYYRIPIADREALLAEQRADMEARDAEERAAEEEEERALALAETKGQDSSTEESEEEEDDVVVELGGEKPLSEEDEVEAAAEIEAEIEAEMEPAAAVEDISEPEDTEDFSDEEPSGGVESFDAPVSEDTDTDPDTESEDDSFGNRIPTDDEVDADGNTIASEGTTDDANRSRNRGGRGRGRGGRSGGDRGGDRGRNRGGRGGRGGPRHSGASSRRVEVLGGDGIDGDRPARPTSRRHYKIQEVIKRGQIMLVQASKEERGNKGAAVTSFLSLPGRYCVLMPNSPRGGGVSRKIANFVERKRMREILSELSVPDGMSVIMRTAGMSRTKVEIKRDLDYLLRLWDDVRELTLKSTAPALIHEEGNLIRRAVRDLYGSDIEEIVVSGEDGFKAARDFMKVMMPSHAKRVIQYKDEQLPLFQRYKVEGQIREMGDPTVVLKSGGYLVINPTEALVSIDVNSGRATRERHIEETALKTNMEAAEEVARQLRLRDLGGLVVIDFIDMEDRRNNAKVERKLRDSLAGDRARIQMGRISSFGLMEMSRQRLNPSLTEAQFEKCPHCLGIGVIRTVDNCAILALRGLEEEGMRARAAELHLSLPNAVAIYILNNKREMLADIERRYDLRVMIRADDSLHTALFKIDVVRNVDTDSDDEDGEAQSGEPTEGSENASRGDRSRSRGGRGGRGRNRSRDEQGGESAPSDNAEGEVLENPQDSDDDSTSDDTPQGERTESADSSGERGARRRGRRGGRGRNGGGDRGGRNDGGRNDGSRGDARGGDRPYEPRGPRATRNDGDAAGSDAVAASSAHPAPKSSGGVEPVFYGRRRSSAVAESAPVSGGGNDSAANDAPPSDSASDTGEKKKGWWNRLVE